jgi:GLPGLI family protein
MKILFSIYLLLLIHFTYGQQITIDFTVKYNQSNYKNELIITDSQTLWKDINDEPTNNSEETFLIKNQEKGVIFMSDYIFGKYFYIKDTLHNMKWELMNETKDILGEKCNSAKTNFRGRTYVAFYSNNLAYSDGPWKFGGLPGLILEVQSNDGLYQFIANKITKNSNTKINQITLSKYKFINWYDFTQKFILTVDNTIKMIKSNASTIENNSRGYLKIDAPEIIYSKVQEGKGIEY